MTDNKKDDLNLGATFVDISGNDAEQLVQAAKEVKPPHASLKDEMEAMLSESDRTEEDIRKAFDGGDETPSNEEVQPSWIDDLGM